LSQAYTFFPEKEGTFCKQPGKILFLKSIGHSSAGMPDVFTQIQYAQNHGTPAPQDPESPQHP
jgi:hypothetical protein